MTARPTEKVALIACIDPDQYAAGEINSSSDVIDMSKWHELLIVISVGDMEATATVDVDIETGSTSTTFDTTLSSKDSNQFVAGTDDNKQLLINLRSDEIGTDRYVNVEVNIGNDSVDMGVHVFGLKPRFAPGSDDELASIKQTVE